jgi:ribosomal protein S18 acetylase RimI-like enzyme
MRDIIDRPDLPTARFLISPRSDAAIRKRDQGTFRRARGGESAVLTAIARRSKAHWGYDDVFIDLVAPGLTITEQAIASHEIWVFQREDGEILGFHRVIPGEPAVLEDLWLEPHAIGSGHGRTMWNHAVAIARAMGAASMELDAEPHAIGFYRHIGAIQVGATASNDIPGRWLPRMRFALQRGSPAQR